MKCGRPVLTMGSSAYVHAVAETPDVEGVNSSAN